MQEPRRHRLDPWVRKIPWRREWQPIPVFLPGESLGQRNLLCQSMGSQRFGHDWVCDGNATPLQYSCLENPMNAGAWWAAVHRVAKSRTWLSDFTFTLPFHALEKDMATHSSVLAWRIPGTGEPGGLPFMGSHRVGHDWSDLVAAVAEHVMDGWLSFSGPLVHATQLHYGFCFHNYKIIYSFSEKSCP